MSNIGGWISNDPSKSPKLVTVRALTQTYDGRVNVLFGHYGEDRTFEMDRLASKSTHTWVIDEGTYNEETK